MIGENIKKLREKNGYSPEKFAKKLHINTYIIHLWENGDGIPTIQLIMCLCELFKVSCNEILLGETDILYIDHLNEQYKQNIRVIYNSFLDINKKERK